MKTCGKPHEETRDSAAAGVAGRGSVVGGASVGLGIVSGYLGDCLASYVGLVSFDEGKMDEDFRW